MMTVLAIYGTYCVLTGKAAKAACEVIDWVNEKLDKKTGTGV